MSDKTIKFDQKTAIVLDSRLSATNAMIVVAHLMLPLGHIAGGIFGKTLTDLSGNDYPPLSRYPVSVLQAESGTLKTLERSIRQAGVTCVRFPRQALDIWTDAELVEDIRQRTEAEIIFLGVALHSERNRVDRLIGGLRLFKAVNF